MPLNGRRRRSGSRPCGSIATWQNCGRSAEQTVTRWPVSSRWGGQRVPPASSTGVALRQPTTGPLGACTGAPSSVAARPESRQPETAAADGGLEDHRGATRGAVVAAEPLAPPTIARDVAVQATDRVAGRWDFPAPVWARGGTARWPDSASKSTGPVSAKGPKPGIRGSGGHQPTREDGPGRGREQASYASRRSAEPSGRRWPRIADEVHGDAWSERPARGATGCGRLRQARGFPGPARAGKRRRSCSIARAGRSVGERGLHPVVLVDRVPGSWRKASSDPPAREPARDGASIEWRLASPSVPSSTSQEPLRGRPRRRSRPAATRCSARASLSTCGRGGVRARRSRSRRRGWSPPVRPRRR